MSTTSPPLDTAAFAALGADLVGDQPVLGPHGDLAAVEVGPGAWTQALSLARDGLGLAWFDWLGGVDELDRLRVVTSLRGADGDLRGRGLLLSTVVPVEDPVLPSATAVFAGAAWHERETYEMFGVRFTAHPGLRPLLLPPGFVGHPLRKDFVLAARAVRPWPGEHEPSGRTRRRTGPAGVPGSGPWSALGDQEPT